MKIIDEFDIKNKQLLDLIDLFCFGRYKDIPYKELKTKIGRLSYLQVFYLLVNVYNLIEWNNETIKLFFDFEIDNKKENTISNFRMNCSDINIQSTLEFYAEKHNVVDKFYFYSHQHSLISKIIYKIIESDDIELINQSIRTSEYGKDILIYNAINNDIRKGERITLNKFIDWRITMESSEMEWDVSNLFYPDISGDSNDEIEEYKNYIILALNQNQIIDIKYLSLVPCYFTVNHYAKIITYVLKNSTSENEFQLLKTHFINAIKYFKRNESHQYSNGVYQDEIKRNYKIKDLELIDDGILRDFFNVDALIYWIENVFISKKDIHLKSGFYDYNKNKDLLESGKITEEEYIMLLEIQWNIYENKVDFINHKEKDKITLLIKPNRFLKILSLFFKQNGIEFNEVEKNKTCRFIKNIIKRDDSFKVNSLESVDFFTRSLFSSFCHLLYFLDKEELLILPGPSLLTRTFMKELKYLEIGISRRDTFSKIKIHSAETLLKKANLSKSILGSNINKPANFKVWK